MGNKALRLLRANPNGFTLIELMIAIAISAIAMTAIYGVFITTSRSYRTQEGAVDAQQRARAGLDFMTKAIRTAGLHPRLDPSDDAIEGGAVGIKLATAQIIRFTADMDMNGTIDNQNEERLTFTYDGVQTLSQIRYEGAPNQSTQPLVDRVSALNFTYLDTNGNVIAAPVPAANLADIRSVIITISCQGMGSGRSSQQIHTRTLSTMVSCRNLGI